MIRLQFPLLKISFCKLGSVILALIFCSGTCCKGDQDINSNKEKQLRILATEVYFKAPENIFDNYRHTPSFFQVRTVFNFNCHFIHFCKDQNGSWNSWSTSKISLYDYKENYYGTSGGELNCNSTSNTNLNETMVNISKFIQLHGQCYLNVEYKVYLAPKDYCILRFVAGRSTTHNIEESLQAEVLICQQPLIVKKCCGLLQSADLTIRTHDHDTSASALEKRCIPTNSNNYSFLWHYENSTSLLSFKTSSFEDVAKLKDIGNSTKIVDGRGSFHVRESGIFLQRRLGVFLRGRLTELNGDYCLESLQIPHDSRNLHVVLFYDGSPEVQARDMAIAIGSIWLFVAPFAFLAAIANFLILQRNIFGIILSTYLVSSGFTNVFASVIVFTFNINGEDNDSTDCSILDIVQKLSYSSTTIWLVIVNFDLWWNFRKLRNNNSLTMKQDINRFISYLIFGIVAAGCHVALSYLVGYFYRSKSSEIDTQMHCVLYTLPSLIAFSIVVILLIVTNTFFFIVTWLNIRSHRSLAGTIRANNIKRKNKATTRSFKLYSKLFMMAGPNRLVRIAILFAHFNYSFLSPVGVLLECLFSIPDLILCFFVFCHKDYRKKIAHTFSYLNGKLETHSTSEISRTHPATSTK